MTLRGVVLLLLLSPLSGAVTLSADGDHQCPAVERLGHICQMRLGEPCGGEGDCDIRQSCCETGCGRWCVVNVEHGRGPGGGCPEMRNLQHMCRMNFTAPCNSSASCRQWGFCCPTECGPRCVPKIMAGDTCTSDEDCVEPETCCRGSCRTNCTQMPPDGDGDRVKTEEFPAEGHVAPGSGTVGGARNESGTGGRGSEGRGQGGGDTPRKWTRPKEHGSNRWGQAGMGTPKRRTGSTGNRSKTSSPNGRNQGSGGAGV